MKNYFQCFQRRHLQCSKVSKLEPRELLFPEAWARGTEALVATEGNNSCSGSSVHTMQIPEQQKCTKKTLQHLDTLGLRGGSNSPTVHVRAQPGGPFGQRGNFSVFLNPVVPQTWILPRWEKDVFEWRSLGTKNSPKEGKPSHLTLFYSFVFLRADQQGFNPQFCTTTHHARPFFQIVFLFFFRFYYLTTFNLKSSLDFIQWKSLVPHFLKLLKFIISRRTVI